MYFSFFGLAWLYEVEIIIYFCFSVAIFIAFYAKKIIKDKKIRRLINIVLGGLIIAPILKKKLYMDAQIITFLSGSASLALTYGLREWTNSRNRKREKDQQKKEVSARDKVLDNRLIGLEDNMVDVKMMLKDMQDDTDFRNILRNSIREATDTFININRTLDDHFKNILMDYSKITENISMRWYNSEYRGVVNRDKMEKYLKNYLKPSLKNTDNLINSSIDTIKVTSNHDLRGCLFADFIKKNGLYNEFELLIMALCQNGFQDEKEVVDKFTNFINRLFTKFGDLVTVWNTMDRKDLLNEA